MVVLLTLPLRVVSVFQCDTVLIYTRTCTVAIRKRDSQMYF